MCKLLYVLIYNKYIEALDAAMAERWSGPNIPQQSRVRVSFLLRLFES